MFKHLLIPLDGSSLAEAALPAAAYLAQTLGANVTLLHVIEHNAPDTVHRERHLTDPDEACAYLGEVRARAFPPEAHVEQHVHTREVNDVARSIVVHSEEMAPDLIIMCAHGNSGLRGLIFGSIAQQVIGMGVTPILLIRPQAERGAFALHKLLVALDGSAEHEQCLPVAAGLAQASGAALHLLTVVPTRGTLSGKEAATGTLLPGATAAMLELAEAGAVDYLRAHLARLQAEGLSASAEVARGDTASLIVATARKTGSDVIVLGTHGKAGMDAFFEGSVGPKVAALCELPLLLVPVGKSTSH
jgi:nucleotide-binding universal stress UspA family protein